MSQQTSRLNAWSQTLPFPDPLRVMPLHNRLEMVPQEGRALYKCVLLFLQEQLRHWTVLDSSNGSKALVLVYKQNA